ncbi:MAG: sigma-70 family RNA polymerase sigma factor [Chloroflexi bacterium]|nr:sigma-70 family RNA polymerase sigma factor [Chloroflexota bacterium]
MRYADLPDETLIKLTDQGNKEALSALYDKHGGRVYCLALKLLADKESAEEVAQDTFVKVWQRASSYSQEKGQFSSWLLSVAHHRAIDELRRRRRTRTDANLPEERAALVRDPDPDPVDQVLSQERSNLVRDALGQLPDAQREVIALAYFKGLTQTEIAERLKTPLGTVKTRMRLALQKLKPLLAMADA